MQVANKPCLRHVDFGVAVVCATSVGRDLTKPSWGLDGLDAGRTFSSSTALWRRREPSVSIAPLLVACLDAGVTEPSHGGEAAWVAWKLCNAHYTLQSEGAVENPRPQGRAPNRQNHGQGKE